MRPSSSASSFPASLIGPENTSHIVEMKEVAKPEISSVQPRIVTVAGRPTLLNSTELIFRNSDLLTPERKVRKIGTSCLPYSLLI